MHTIEPFWNWRTLYTAENDPDSPFFGREYSEFEFSDQIYNHLIHPQWDYFGSETLFAKLLFVEDEEGYAIMELLGEWNDCLYNDIMHFKRNVIDVLLERGINKYIVIGENVLNFHSSDDCYYEEWFEDIEDGWIVFLNFREHVLREFSSVNVDHYFISGGELDDLTWRKHSPEQLIKLVSDIVNHRID